jgi:hypothetical protein
MSNPIVECEKRMKLFVVGEVSPNPDEWRSNHDLVIASDADEAREMIDYTVIVTEIPMDRAMVLS